MLLHVHVGEKVEMIYLDQQGEITQRIITVHKVYKTYIRGFCHQRQGYRTFLCDNILSIHPYNGSYKNKRDYLGRQSYN